MSEGYELEMQRRLLDLGRRWHVVFSVGPMGEWVCALRSPRGSRVYRGESLDGVIGAAWASAPEGWIT